MKVLSLFSGIGAFEKALDNLGIPYKLVGYCEIDKYASKSYSAIHGVSEDMNLGDITKIDEKALPKDIDLITYGFPCQDISLAGKQKGMFNDDGTPTRSGLFFEALRIIEETQPRIAIAENVKNLTGKKFNAQFQIVLASLKAAGYNNYWKVLNAKDYGVPQNRERVFIVSIRKDVDNGTFRFTEGFPLKKRLRDVLEDEVDERYYLSEEQISKITNWKAQQKPFERVLGKESVSPTLTARGAGEYHSGMIVYSPDNQDTTNMQSVVVEKYGIDKSSNSAKIIDVANCITSQEDRGVSNRKGDGTAICEVRQIGQMYPDGGNPQAGRIYDADGISPTMDTCSGGNRMPKVAVAMRGRYNEDGQVEQQIEVSDREYANAITTVQKDSLIAETKIVQRGRGFNKGGIHDLSPTISSHRWKNNNFVYDGFNQCVRADQSCVGTITQNVGKDLKRNGQGIIESNEGGLCIRKLTPKECFRLMGFDDADFEKAKWYTKIEAENLLKRFPKHKGKRQLTEQGRIERMSDTQLYKQSGNSIAVPVVEYILIALIECGALIVTEEER